MISPTSIKNDGVLKNIIKVLNRIPVWLNPLQELLKHNALEHITFTGAIHHNKAREFLASCDAFLSPTQPNQDGTRFFGSPTKIFEYLSIGKPIIASDLEQLSEILSPSFKKQDLKNTLSINDQIGFLLPPHEVSSFVEAACLLMHLHDSDLLKMGNNARKKVVEHYTWDIHVMNMQKFIQNQQT